MSKNEAPEPDASSGILDAAKKIADSGDVWFVSFARALGRTAGRLKKETDIVASSAKSAASTTGRVTLNLVKTMKSGGRAPRQKGGATSDDLVKVVADQYGLEGDALRTDPEAREMIEFLHLRCVRAQQPAAPAAPVEKAAEAAGTPSPDPVGSSEGA